MSYNSDQLRKMRETMLKLAADPTSELYHEGHQRSGAGHRAAFWDGYNGLERSPHIIPGTYSAACAAAGRIFRKQQDKAGQPPGPQKARLKETSMYIIEKEEGISLDLDKRMAQRPTIRFVIKCALDQRIVWSSVKRWADTSPGTIAGMRLQASNVMKRYESYLRQHGKRWEIVEEEKRILAKNKKRLADLDALIPKLEAERDKLRLEISKQAEANSLINEA